MGYVKICIAEAHGEFTIQCCSLFFIEFHTITGGFKMGLPEQLVFGTLC